MSHLALGRLRPVLDLRQQLRPYPDRLVGDLLGIGLGLAVQRRQAFPQRRRPRLVEATILPSMIAEPALMCQASSAIFLKRLFSRGLAG